MAAAHNNLLTIISVFTFDVIFTLKGHNDSIHSLAFSNDDRYLFSGGEDGAVYQWDMETGTRIHEIVQKGIAYNSLVTSSDPLFAYAVTDTGLLREIGDSQIHREVKPPNVEMALKCLTMSRSNLVMFMASDQGHLFNVQLPFIEAGGGTCTNYRFFHGSITQMRISYDDTLLVTASSQGTLAVWAILNNENRIASLDRDLGKCGEILISRKILMDRLETIKSLELRMQQQADEFTYQKRRGDKFHSHTVAQIHKDYMAEIEELKRKIETMESAHIEQLNLITSKIAESKEEHQQGLQDLESRCHKKIIIEYEKFARLRSTMDEIRQDYEHKLQQSAECLRGTVASLESDFQRQLQERQDLIRQLTQQMEDKKQEFLEYGRQVETDNDRHLVDTQLTYEKKLKAEQEVTLKWRSQAGILKKKHDTLTKENEELREEIDTLKEAHSKHQNTIALYTHDIEVLRHEIEERDATIADKEKQIQELTRKNQELEKFKQLLNHKITELKAQIEPRERQIKEKRNQIVEMERELDGLKQNNMQLDLQLNELKDKYRAAEVELETERTRARQARNYISRICGDIYQISRITDPRRLADDMTKLYHKYSDSAELQKSMIADAQIEGEFQRQRNFLEKGCKARAGRKTESIAMTKLIKENVVLLEEINGLRKQLELARKRISGMESLLGVGGKTRTAPLARQKLEKALTNIEEMERVHQSEVEYLKQQIQVLTKKKQDLHFETNQRKISQNNEE